MKCWVNKPLVDETVVFVFEEALTLASKVLNPPSCNLAKAMASSSVVGFIICVKFLSSPYSPPIKPATK